MLSIWDKCDTVEPMKNGNMTMAGYVLLRAVITVGSGNATRKGFLDVAKMSEMVSNNAELTIIFK